MQTGFDLVSVMCQFSFLKGHRCMCIYSLAQVESMVYRALVLIDDTRRSRIPCPGSSRNLLYTQCGHYMLSLSYCLSTDHIEEGKSLCYSKGRCNPLSLFTSDLVNYFAPFQIFHKRTFNIFPYLALPSHPTCYPSILIWLSVLSFQQTLPPLPARAFGLPRRQIYTIRQ